MIWLLLLSYCPVMEELMSEATDLILSPNQNEGTVQNKELQNDFESGYKSSQDATKLNSINLLRMSITNSLRHRNIGNEDIMDKRPKVYRNKRRKESLVKSLRNSDRLLNSELVSLHPESKTAEQDGLSLNGQHDHISSNITTKIFTNLLNSDVVYGQKMSNSIDSSISYDQDDEKDDSKMNGMPTDNEEQNKRKKLAQNGIKLASRKFSDNIFENCSTYGLTCPDILSELTKQDSTTKGQSSASKGALEVNLQNAKGVRSIATENSNLEDQVSLGDSFFVNITSDDPAPKNGLFGKGTDNSNERSVKDSSSKKNGFLPHGDSTSDAEDMLQLKSERRLSKKLRKRNKKNKSKDVPSYECPKCGVSYVLSNKVSERTAFCLHCDFWTSVEPEFLKREKQAWNTCRIC